MLRSEKCKAGAQWHSLAKEDNEEEPTWAMCRRTASWGESFWLWLTVEGMQSMADYFQMVSRETEVQSGHMEVR